MYEFIGPDELLQRAKALGGGQVIKEKGELLPFSHRDIEPFTLTYIVSMEGLLTVDERGTEHVVCAAGRPVLSAGEITLRVRGSQVELLAVSNQSTGYCPEPESWPAVKLALNRLGLMPPDRFTDVFDFRRCPKCRSINIIKEQDFFCAVCDSALPRNWNF